MRKSEKIYYDLTESVEYVELLGNRFYFSSSFNKERFLRGYESYIKTEEDKIIAKYGVKISIRFYLLMAYYLRIEKRGFYIKRYADVTGDYTIEIKRSHVSFTEIEV